MRTLLPRVYARPIRFHGYTDGVIVHFSQEDRRGSSSEVFGPVSIQNSDSMCDTVDRVLISFIPVPCIPVHPTPQLLHLSLG